MNPKLKTVSSLYEEDFALWIERTAQLLREHSFEEVDWENVIEEIESLVKSDRRALRSQIVRVLKHLLKLDYQPRTYPPTNWLTSLADRAHPNRTHNRGFSQSQTLLGRSFE